MYSEEQYRKALEVYEETKSVTKTITLLGYSVHRQTLYNWINRKRILSEEKLTFCGYNNQNIPGILRVSPGGLSPVEYRTKMGIAG